MVRPVARRTKGDNMKKYLPRVVLYENREKDREILAWLEKIPTGFKTQSIKDAIWASIKGIELPSPVPVRPFSESVREYKASPTKNSTMRASLTFDTRELLADIRQIVEAGVAQALAHHPTSVESTSNQEEENEIETMLDNLDISFMLDDDEEE